MKTQNLLLLIGTPALATAFFTPRNVVLDARRTQLLQLSGGDIDPRQLHPEIQSAKVEQNHTLAGSGSFSTFSREGSFLRKALRKNVMFANLPESSLNTLIDAFELIEVNQNQVLVQQGDPSVGGYVYVIAKGECTVTVDGKIVPEPYGVLPPQSIIGELGILEGKERAATVSARSDKVTLYRIDGTAFKTILNTPAEDVIKLEAIDEAIKQISGQVSQYGGDIIVPYKPNRIWLWRQWSGTILQHSIYPTMTNMFFSLVVILVARKFTGSTLGLGMPPDKSHPIIARLDIIHKIWSYQTSLTIFILTFFLNQAYGFWQNVHGIARRIQGRLNDFMLMLAISCKRNPDGTYTKESERLLDDVASYSRLFHALLWASCANRFKVLLTDLGLKRMAARGLMTSKQLETLQSLDIPRNQKHNACLEWMIIRALRGVDDGTIRGDFGTTHHLQQTILTLRGTYATIGDALSTRMPLAYTHFVQILVDSFVIMAPIALYSTLGDKSILCVGIITLFYTGLLDLAKIFLDPLNNEGYYRNSIYMDLGVLIRESNAGSTRWKNGGAQLPF
mmetsp:Transcript_13419/g.29141  ORF Transcript_13419/g.29141 Transcript_13419/m.29141 type:complete len:563 (+) Transcript_13419:83-1771(+)|eukprot:CAMPEP_0172327326 /NCGR_PEP_ID=MMETSP1058-20130122/59258_1 /TAXON_ID=83371 /ORGANISM="Detonula confervacea, Strain CCMP 353" /LENGTH=562 /DNA_ID=CAMNT_0013044343 /DNA_START=64 /DNA_END=1752 /DNA_ORIENTATION=+